MSHDMTADMGHAADSSEVKVAAVLETAAQATAADSHTLAAAMLDNAKTLDGNEDHAASNAADQSAAKDSGAELAPSQDHSAAQTEEQQRSAFLNDLREQNEALKPLDDAALERILASGDQQKMRGQLVEEFGNLQLEQIARDMGPEYSFIRGDQVRDENNRQITDGMIVRKAEDGVLDVVAIAEAKAGEASRRELTSSHELFEDLSAADHLELQNAAIDEWRETHDADGPGDPGWISSQDILNDLGAEVDQLMRDIHGRDIGQLARDFERLMPNAGDESVTLKVDGVEADVRVSRAQTEAYVITPEDVSTDRVLANFKEKEPNIQTHSINIDLAADELSELALSMRAIEQQRQEELQAAEQRRAEEYAQRMREVDEAMKAFEHA